MLKYYHLTRLVCRIDRINWLEILVPLLCGPSCRKRPISIHFGIYGHAQRLRIPSKQGKHGTTHSTQSTKVTRIVPEVATDSISVHAHELVLSQATFTPSQGSVCQSSSIALKTKLKTTVIDFEEVLPVGKGVLEIKFRGTLNETWTQVGTVKWSRIFWASHQYTKGDDWDSSKRLPYAHLLVETSFQILRETVYHFDLSVLSVLSQSFRSCLKTTNEMKKLFPGPDGRILPFTIHRLQGREAFHGHHAIRSDWCQTLLPLLGWTCQESHLCGDHDLS